MFRGSRASSTPRQALLCPQRGPPRRQQFVVTGFCQGGLHCGHHTSQHHARSATKRGELHDMRLRHAGDTPPEGFVWCKTPTAAGMEGAGGTTAGLRRWRDRKAGLRGTWAAVRRGRRGVGGQRTDAPRQRLAARAARGPPTGAPSSPAPRPGPAPGKPAGPQATTNTTQQHAVPYNPDPANQVENETPKHGPDDRQEREDGDGRDDDSCLTQLECPLRPVIPGEETSEAPRRRHHAEQEEQGEYVPGQRLDDLRDRGGWRHFDGRRCRRWVHSCRSCVPHAPTSTLSGSATGPRLTTGHTRAQTRINAGAAQTHSLRGPRSFRDDVAQSLTA